MKNKCVLVLAFLIGNFVFAQKSFQKSRIVLGLNWDLGIYKTEAFLNDLPSLKEDDAAVSSITGIWGEYGVNNWLGVGLRIARSRYFAEKDTLTNTVPNTSSNDIGLQLSLHPIKTKKFDLPIIIVLGSSGFKRDSKDAINSLATDRGTFYNLAVNPRFFFGEKARFGMNVKLGLAGYTYNSIDISNNITSFEDVYTLTGRGANFMFGFQYNLK